MIDRRSDIVTELTASLNASIAFFRSLKPEELNKKVYADGAVINLLQKFGEFLKKNILKKPMSGL